MPDDLTDDEFPDHASFCEDVAWARGEINALRERLVAAEAAADRRLEPPDAQVIAGLNEVLYWYDDRVCCMSGRELRADEAAAILWLAQFGVSLPAPIMAPSHRVQEPTP